MRKRCSNEYPSPFILFPLAALLVAIALTSCSLKNEGCDTYYVMPDGAKCELKTSIGHQSENVLFKWCNSRKEYINPPSYEPVIECKK